jgi:hypothetical protein
LVRESWWLLVVAAVANLALILASYTKHRSRWVFSGTGEPSSKPAGGPWSGAWIAELSQYSSVRVGVVVS